MSPKSPTRRQFVKRAGLYIASSSIVLPAGFACSSDEDGGNDGYLPYPPWQSKANALENGANCCWTAAQPGGEGGPANHAPMLSVSDNGELKVWLEEGHPMTAAHWITTAYVRDQRGVVLELADFGERDIFPQFLSADNEWRESTPLINIELPAGTTEVKAYAYCSLHQHWASPVLAI